MTSHLSGAVRTADFRPGAGPWVPPGADLAELAAATHGCGGCELNALGTPPVFGSGRPTARVVLVGDHPTSTEDLRLPFAGRVARLLDRALIDAGFAPSDLYRTTAVKHVRIRPDGAPHPRVLPPDPVHVMACRPWLGAELARVDPLLVVALGTTAARALTGPSFRMSRDRGVPMPWPTTAAPGLLPNVRLRPGARLLATVHPAAVLAAEDLSTAYDNFVDDLRLAAETVGELKSSVRPANALDTIPERDVFLSHTEGRWSTL